MNPFASVPWLQVRKLTHQLDQASIHIRTLGLVPLRRMRLTQCLACLPLRDPQTTSHAMNRAPPPLGVDQFGQAASLRISIDKAWSATSFFKRRFSFYRSFVYLAICGSIPPYV